MIHYDYSCECECDTDVLVKIAEIRQKMPPVININNTTIISIINQDPNLNIEDTSVVLGYTTILTNLKVHNSTLLLGNVTIGSNLNIAGNLSLTNQTLSSNLYVSGISILNSNTTINSKLNVLDDVYLNKSLGVSGPTILNSDASIRSRLNVLGESVFNSVTIRSTLFVSNNSLFNSTVSVNSNLNVSGRASFLNNVTNASTLNVSGNTQIEANLNVRGTLNVSNVSTFNNNAIFNSDIRISGLTNFFNPVNINFNPITLNSVALNVTGNTQLGTTTVKSNLNVSGSSFLDSNTRIGTPVTNTNLDVYSTTKFYKPVEFNNLSYINISAPTTIYSTLTVTNDTVIGGNLTVLGSIAMNQNMTIDTVQTNNITTSYKFSTTFPNTLSVTDYFEKILFTSDLTKNVAYATNAVTSIATIDVNYNTIINNITFANNIVDFVLHPTLNIAYVVHNSLLSIVNTSNNTLIEIVNTAPPSPPYKKMTICPNLTNDVAYLIQDSIYIQPYKLSTKTVLLNIENVTEKPVDVKFSLNGNIAYALGTSKIFLINVLTGSSYSTISLPTANPFVMSICPDASKPLAYVLNKNVSGTITKINLNTNLVIGSFNVGSLPTDIVFTSDGKQAWVINSGSGDVSIINVPPIITDNESISTMVIRPNPKYIDINKNNSKLYVSHNASRFITVLDRYIMVYGYLNCTNGLLVDSFLDINNGARINGTLNVNGTTNLQNVNVNNGFIVYNNVTVSSNLSVSGNAMINNLMISNTSLLNNDTTIGSILNVSGATILNNDTTIGSLLNVSGVALLNNDTTILSLLNVSGVTLLNNDTTIGSMLNVLGNTILNNSSTITSNLYVSGNSIFNNIGVGTFSPNNNSLLELNSTTKGFLPPRMTSAQRSNIISPTPGLIVFDTDLNNLYAYGTTWSAVGSEGSIDGLNINYVPVASGVKSITNSIIYQIGDNIGISNTTPNAKLHVSGNTILNNDTTIGSNLNIIGNTSISGNSTIRSNLSVYGSTTIYSNLNISGSTLINNNLNVSGVTTLANNLNITGTATISNDLNVTGTANVATNLNILGNGYFNNNLIVTGSTILANNLDVTGGTKLASTLDVNGLSKLNNTIVGGTLDVTGNTVLYGNLDISGSLNVIGSATTIQSQVVTINDNILLINSNQTGTPSSILQSGIEIERGDLDNYRFIFNESDDSFKIGLINSLQTVATREDTPNNNSIPFWNSSASRFDTSNNIVYNSTNSTLLLSNLYVTGSSTISGNSTINSNLNIIGSLYVSSSSILNDSTILSSLNVSGNTTVLSNFNVSGITLLNATTIRSSLNVSSITLLNTTTIGSTLNVSGITILSNETTLGSTLNVSGITILSNATTLGSSLNVSGISILSNATTLGSSLNVSGITILSNATTLGSSLNVSGITLLNTTTIGSSLNVSGISIFNNSIGIGNTILHNTALLDLSSTTKGFLPPRMTTTERTNIVDPAIGLIIYDSTVNKLFINDSSWNPIGNVNSNGLTSNYIPIVINGNTLGDSNIYQDIDNSLTSIGGTYTDAILNVQSNQYDTFSPNTDPTTYDRPIIIQNNITSNSANEYSGIGLQINPWENIGTGKVYGDIKLVRETTNQSNSYFMFSAYRTDNSFKDYLKLDYENSYLYSPLTIGSSNNPDSSALLDLNSTTKGFLPPRMTTIERTNIATPSQGLTVYDTTENKLYIYDSLTWTAVGSGISGLTQFYLPVATSSNTISDSIIYQSSNNIGIGITNPSALLHVSGTTVLLDSTIQTTLTVSGNSIFNDSIIGNTLTVSGTSNFNNSIIGNTLTVSGNSNINTMLINNTLNVSGTSNLNDSIIGGTLNVNNTSYLKSTIVNGTLTVSSICDLQHIINQGTLYVSGSTNLNNCTVNSNLTVLNNSNLNTVTIRSTLNVSSISIFNNSVGIGTNLPNSNALLDLSSTTKGFLPPRMTTTERTNISTPTQGLTVYDTTENKLYIYDSLSWTAVGSGGGGGGGSGISGLTQYYLPVATSSNTIGDSVIYQSNNNIAIGGTTTSGLVTIQKSYTDTYNENTNPNDDNRALIIQNNTSATGQNLYTTLSFQLVPNVNNKVIGDLRVIRDEYGSASFIFSGTFYSYYYDYCKFGFYYSYFPRKLTIGSKNSPPGSALLSLDSTEYGFLPPRMTSTQRNNIYLPSQGLIVYDTTEGALYTYSSTGWTSVGGGSGGGGGISGLSTNYIPLAINSTTIGDSSIYQAASNQVAIGGTDTRGVLTIQKDHDGLFSNNSDPGDYNRTFVMQNNNTFNTANQYANITMQINPNGGIGYGRVLGDIRLVRESNYSSDSYFMLSSYRNDQTYKDFCKFGYDNSYFVGNVGIGTTYPYFKLDVNGNIRYSGTIVGGSGNQNAAWSYNDMVPTSTYRSIMFGTENALNNSAEISYTYSSTNSTANRVGIGFYGNAEKMVVQAEGNVGIGTSTPTTTALLDLSSTTKGFLPPRMTTTDRSNINSPALGLMLYDTTEDKLYIYKSSGWTVIV